MRGQDYSLQKALKCTTGGTFVEIGTWEGNFSKRLLESTTCKKLYCVDPYKHFDAGIYPDAINNLTQEKFDQVYESTRKSLECFGDRVEFIRLCSSEAVKLFEDESLDFVYIDGNHDYKFVEEDIRLWFPKVKKGCYLCGDDVYSLNLSEHDSDNNVTRIWTRNHDGSPACWGKYGTYPACIANEKLYGIKFLYEDTQFSYHKQ
jgi:hypothetical protein